MITAFDRKWEIHPILKIASSRNSTPVTSVMAATSSTASSSETEASATALPATAASAELGPVAICLQVPKSAYRIAPAAAFLIAGRIPLEQPLLREQQSTQCAADRVQTVKRLVRQGRQDKARLDEALPSSAADGREMLFHANVCRFAHHLQQADQHGG